MLYFLEKTGKLPQRWGLRPQTPLAFSGSNYFKITTYYIILECCRLVGPLAKLAPLWLKPLVTPLPAGMQ